MYVEYDSVRDFFFLVPPAFLGALADFLEGVLAILLVGFCDVLELGRNNLRRLLLRSVNAPTWPKIEKRPKTPETPQVLVRGRGPVLTPAYSGRFIFLGSLIRLGFRSDSNLISSSKKVKRPLWAGVGTEAPPRTRVRGVSGVFGCFAIFGHVGALTDLKRVFRFLPRGTVSPTPTHRK